MTDNVWWSLTGQIQRDRMKVVQPTGVQLQKADWVFCISTAFMCENTSKTDHQISIKNSSADEIAKSIRWQTDRLTVNSVTSNRWQVSVSSVTVIIYRQTTFSDPTSRVCLRCGIPRFLQHSASNWCFGSDWNMDSSWCTTGDRPWHRSTGLQCSTCSSTCYYEWSYHWWWVGYHL